LLYDGPDSQISYNEQLSIIGLAEPAAEIAMCASYPSFNMLETLPIYPSYSERLWMQTYKSINFNEFEEWNIRTVTNTFAFEKELSEALSRPEFDNIKKVFLKMLQI